MTQKRFVLHSHGKLLDTHSNTLHDPVPQHGDSPVFKLDGWLIIASNGGKDLEVIEIAGQEEIAGPGTKLKNFLSGLGITEEWYKLMKTHVGLPPNCNCKKREDLMNAAWAGYQEGGWAEAKRRFDEVQEYYSKPR